MGTKVAKVESPADLDYVLSRLAWRSKLSDVDVRALAYEYRINREAMESGVKPMDECLADAWAEYKDRFGGTPHQEFLKRNKVARASKRGKRGSSSRSQRGSLSPLYNQRGELL